MAERRRPTEFPGDITVEEMRALRGQSTPDVPAPQEQPPPIELETPTPLCSFERLLDMSQPCPACNSDGGSCSLCKGSVMRRTYLAGAPQEDGELRAAAQALVDKLDEVCASPEWGSVFALADLHHAPYRGPTFGPERDALKAALSTPAGTPPVELTTDSARKGRSVMKRDIEIVATPDNTATVKVEGHELHGITAIDFSIRAGYPRREPDVTITVLSDRFSYAGPADLVVNSVLGTEPLIGVLRRYIEHVEGCEGDNFIDSLDPDDLLSEEDRGWLRAIRALPR